MKWNEYSADILVVYFIHVEMMHVWILAIQYVFFRARSSTFIVQTASVVQQILSEDISENVPVTVQ